MADINVTGLDNPLTPGVDEGTTNVNGMLVNHPTVGVNSGTGGYTPFLRQQGPGSDTASQGFNTDDPAAFDPHNSGGLDADASWTQSLLVGDLPIVIRNGVAYYEIRLDLNEPNNANLDKSGQPNPYVALSEFQLYTSDGQATLADFNTDFSDRAFDEADGYHLVYDLDAGGDNTLILADGLSGSGNDDYGFFIPVSFFGTYDPTLNFTLFAQFGPNPEEDSTFEEFRIQTVSRINGVKFNDADSDGVKDPGENGLAGFTMYIDLNGNDKLDAGEITAKSDANGAFTFYSLVAGTYTVREILSTGDIEASYLATLTPAQITNYLPPNGLWDLTTGTVSGDHSVTIVSGSNATLNVGNHLLQPSMNVDKTVLSVTGGDNNGTPANTADDRVNSANDIINYRITIQNTGDVALTGVTVTDAVEAYGATNATYVSGDTNTNSILDVGETWVYSASYSVTQADIDNNGGGDGDIDNIAVGDTNETAADSDDASVLIIRTSAIDVVKTVVSVTNGDNNGTPGDLTDDRVNSAGDVINYGISIANTGNVTLTGVTVTDQVEAHGVTNAMAVLGVDAIHNIGDVNNDGELDVGETWRYTASYTVTQADINAAAAHFGGDGDIDNIAVGDTSQTPPDSDDEDVPIVFLPSIDVVKSVVSVTGGDNNGTPGNLADDRVNSANDVINYSLSILNNGNVALTGVTMTDQVEAHGVTNATAVLAGAFNVGDTNTDGIFDVGETWLYTASYTVTQADIDAAAVHLGGDGDIDNIAVGDTAQTGPDSDDANVPIVFLPSIDVVKSVVSVTNGDNNGTPGDLTDDRVNSAGDIINYSLTIQNTGNVALNGVTMTDQVEAHGVTNATAVMAGAFNIGDTDMDGLFDVGETWRYTASYTVTQADINAAAAHFGGDGDIDNIAVGDTAQTGPDSDDEDVPIVFLPSINVVKSVVSVTNGDNNGTPGDLTDDRVNSAGDIINYSLSIVNDGNVALTGVTMTDQVEAHGVTNATAVLAGAFNVGDTNTDGIFDVGETWLYAASYTVTQADIDAAAAHFGGDGDIDNIAVGDTAQTGPDSDDEDVPIVFLPQINVVKSVVSVTNGDNNGTPGDLTDDRVNSAGDIINYSLTIQNTGNVALTGVTMTDNVEGQGAINATAVLGIDGIHNVGDINNDGDLDVGETWRYTASYLVTQADIDAALAAGGDGDIDNIAIGDTGQTPPSSDDEDVPVVSIPSIDVIKDVVSVTNGDNNGTPGDLTDDRVNSANDVINYAISIANTGNVALTGVSVTDQVEAHGVTNAVAVLGVDAIHNIGDTNNDGELDVGETWRYTAAYTVTQADIDAAAVHFGGDGDIDNIAIGDTDQTGPDSDNEDVPIVFLPSIDVVKSVVSVSGGDTNGTAGDLTDDRVNSANDVINYAISILNNGNVALTGVTMIDQVEAYGATNATAVLGVDAVHNIGDTDNDGIFDVGETWRYTASYTVTQADIDNNGGGNGLIDNIATGDTAQTGPDSDDAFVPILRTITVDLEKYVSVTGLNGTYVDADTAALGPQNVNLGAPVFFMVTVQNTGNVTLTNPLITDINTSNGGNVSITLYDGVTDTLLAGATLTGDSDGDGNIDVGETWTIKYSQPFDAGDHVNTAYVTTVQGASDNDAAHYFSLVNEGPGVRTPGFWANWTEFWDGNNGNNPKQTGNPGFPEYDLLKIDSNGDGEITNADSGFSNNGGTLGLLIGDYNRNGVKDAGEDIVFISLTDAVKLLTGKEKDMQDGVVKIGRDVVASWLNFLEGNGIGLATDTNSPQHFINDAINYLQMYGDSNGAAVGPTDETFDVFAWSHGGVKTGTSAWTGDYPGGDHSGAEIHSALDYYNNTGMTSPGGMVYAHDADDGMFLTALKVYESII